MKNWFKRTNLLWLALIMSTYIILTVLISAGIINNVYQTVLLTIGINIILAISLNLIIGITGQFSLGHAGFMIIGAYSCGVVAIPTLRLRGDYLAIATLGFGEIIRIIILNMEVTNGAAGLILPKAVSWHMVYWAMVICTLVIVNFGISAHGRACISVREDEIAAEAMGINTTQYKILAFVIGAMIASVAGALYAGAFYVIKPEMFTYSKSIDILVLVVFGGMGSITGSFISTVLVSVLNTVLQQFSSVRMIVYGLALVVIMVFRPSGLLGRKEFSFDALLKKFDKKKGAAS